MMSIKAQSIYITVTILNLIGVFLFSNLVCKKNFKCLNAKKKKKKIMTQIEISKSERFYYESGCLEVGTFSGSRGPIRY